MMNYGELSVELLGHDSIRLKTKELCIYADPFKLPAAEQSKADIVLVTHEHYDHCSIEDLKRICTPATIVVAVADAQSKLSTIKAKKVALAVPGKQFVIGSVGVKAIAAYNIDKFRSPGIPFHPKENEWVGYVVEISGVRVYIAGDTDLIPEMKTLGAIDIAFLPVSGTYVMTAEEAAQAAAIIKPRVAVPMHYGAIVGSASDAQRFKTLAEKAGIRAEIIGK